MSRPVRPARAELVRTLVRGRLPGALRVGDQYGPIRVCHATDPAGRPLVLARDGAELDWVLSGRTGPGRPVVELSVADVPPVDGAPGLGRAAVAGRVRRLGDQAAAAAVHEFAESNPSTDLLDVGRGVSMYLVDVDQVRLDNQRVGGDVPPAEYAAAEPDPLHEVERDLLLDLADHHAERVAGYFRFLLAAAGVPCCRTPPRAVRLDRYGFVVDIGQPRHDRPSDRWVRLDFHRPVHCRHELARRLHPILFPHGPCHRPS